MAEAASAALRCPARCMAAASQWNGALGQKAAFSGTIGLKVSTALACATRMQVMPGIAEPDPVAPGAPAEAIRTPALQ